MERTATIVGQGYVGLPLAQAAAKAGWKIWGLDTNAKTVEAINSGKSHVDDLSDGDIEEMISLGYEATVDPTCIANSQIVVVCVPTPLGDAGSPDLRAVEAATSTVGRHLRKGSTYILESTTYPGTTDNVCVPLLEGHSKMVAGKDFHVAYSPERVDPGSKKFGITNTPKLVGGLDAESSSKAKEFYGSFIDTVVDVEGTKEAETAKLLENTFRHVNIALVNEMAQFCNELGINIWEVIRGASTKPFGFMRFNPGPGVGGHCIPIDPNYLSYEVRKELGYPFRFVELAQEINNSMPAYVVDRASRLLNLEKKALNGSKVLLLGVTYKPDIADQRQSPAVPVAQRFMEFGAEVSYHDPYVGNWNVSDDPASTTWSIDCVDDLEKSVEEADIVVLLQPHSTYDVENLARAAAIFFDTVGITDTDNAVRL
ncbi:UDP-N-acetyl-D-glucosamine dehydrogenase [Corynebacterium sp. HMSC30G07]|uniref:nucleotide sugar dehydrogenase n=1 Tax=Corynebacterium sp. HMSC30G07 TaxID=1581072 RepID=UPI0008A3BA27|nr:nucleotide sugar dehydrogenase [Corynebacterium sp. HMSC30G07]OFT77267.1 UDP-N-acetyl-D-glucosamine dehydrogenase [Corynebacterium sp. HMSC30G07]